jgi:ribosomal protein L37AE/L43A
MQTDPTEEWRRLAEQYREMGDEELLNLAGNFTDLIEPAQQALRQEMRSRGLGDPETASAASNNANWTPQATHAPVMKDDPSAERPAVVLGRAPALVPDESESNQDDSVPHEYTWKTELCDCETTAEAQGLSRALRQAGVDSWIQGSHEFGRRYARVLVAADQLDRAREIAARPVPKEVIDESKDEIPEFVEPQCPKCGSDDVVLEGVDTQNHWRCDACDAEWSDDAEVEDGKAPNAGETAS